jgi:hypothetical protein
VLSVSLCYIERRRIKFTKKDLGDGVFVVEVYRKSQDSTSGSDVENPHPQPLSQRERVALNVFVHRFDHIFGLWTRDKGLGAYGKTDSRKFYISQDVF